MDQLKMSACVMENPVGCLSADWLGLTGSWGKVCRFISDRIHNAAHMSRNFTVSTEMKESWEPVYFLRRQTGISFTLLDLDFNC